MNAIFSPNVVIGVMYLTDSGYTVKATKGPRGNFDKIIPQFFVLYGVIRYGDIGCDLTSGCKGVE